jgi:predicted CopG family antitoxin
MTKSELYSAFEEVTEKLLQLNVEDENVVDLVEEFLNKRDKIIELMKQTEGDVSDEVKLRVLQKNNQVGTKLDEIMLSIKQNIMGVQKEKRMTHQKKRANKGYMGVTHQSDGYFIDKKK